MLLVLLRLQVCLIGDSVGSIIAYDLLCRCPLSKNDLGSRGSLQSCGSGHSGGLDVAGGRSVSNPDLPETGVEVGAEMLSQSFTHGSRDHLAVPNFLIGLEFEVSDFFTLGSPLPLLLAFRRAQGNGIRECRFRDPQKIASFSFYSDLITTSYSRES